MSEKGFVTPLFLAALASFILLWLGGCAHIAPPPANLLAAASNCTKDVRLLAQAKAAQRIQQPMKSEMGQVVMVMAQAMADQNRGDPFAGCNTALIAYMRAEGASTASVNALIGKGIVVGGTVWAVDSLGDTLMGLVGTGGDVISGSRVTKGNVVGQGASASSSGAGLGIGNTRAGQDGAGGLYTRNQINPTAGSTNSNSGEAVVNADVPVDNGEFPPEPVTID